MISLKSENFKGFFSSGQNNLLLGWIYSFPVLCFCPVPGMLSPAWACLLPVASLVLPYHKPCCSGGLQLPMQSIKWQTSVFMGTLFHRHPPEVSFLLLFRVFQFQRGCPPSWAWLSPRPGLSGERLNKMVAFTYLHSLVLKKKTNHKRNAKLIVSVLRGSS